MKTSLPNLLLTGFVFAGLLQAAHTLGPSTTISFEAGRAVLTKESETKLKNFVKEARKSGTINEVQVAVWSDNPAPRKGEELSKSDRELAENRARAIEHCLKRHKVADVDSYNMAERASWLARMFNTDAAELKSEIGRGQEASMSKEEFQVFKINGEPSKAVVLAILEHG